MPSPTLRYRPLWTALGWVIVAAIVWLSLTPSPLEIDVEQGDKLGHFIAYGTLMFWFAQLHASRRARLGYGAAWIALGITLEFIQGQLGWRTGDPLDMLANTIGVLLGAAAAAAVGPRVFEWVERLVP